MFKSHRIVLFTASLLATSAACGSDSDDVVPTDGSTDTTGDTPADGLPDDTTGDGSPEDTPHDTTADTPDGETTPSDTSDDRDVSDTPTELPEAILQGVISAPAGNSALELELYSTPWAATKGIADRLRIGGRAQAGPGGPVVRLDGWRDPTNGEFEFTFTPPSGNAVTCQGTLVDGVATGSCPRGTAGAGSFVVTDVDLEAVVAYCGTFVDTFGFGGGVGVVTAGGAAAAAFGTSGFEGVALGTFTGGALSFTSRAFSAGGTADGTTASGDWSGLGLTGTWTATAGACPFIPDDGGDTGGDTVDDTVDGGDAETDGGGDTRWASATTGCDGDPVDTTGHTNDLFAFGTMGCAAVGASRELHCWGSAAYYWMWLDGLEPTSLVRTMPVVMKNGADPITGVTSMFYSDRTLCWTNTSGEAWCYGVNNYGELGLGAADAFDAPFRETPSRVTVLDALSDSPPAQVQAIYGGLGVQCAIFDGRRLGCWGNNTGGLLGDEPWDLPMSATALEMFPGEVVTDVADGGTLCALLASGEVHCWGQNVNGSIASPDAPAPSSFAAPTRIMVNATTPLTDVVDLEPALGGVCALRDDGSIVCWGQDLSFTLVYPNELTQPAGEYVTLVLDRDYTGTFCGVDAISSSSGHVCTLKGTDVWCFGANNLRGTLGTGFDADGPDPAQAEIGDVVEVEAFGEATCVRGTNGQTWCWGTDTSSQIPQGSNGDYEPLPYPITP